MTITPRCANPQCQHLSIAHSGAGCGMLLVSGKACGCVKFEEVEKVKQ